MPSRTGRMACDARLPTPHDLHKHQSRQSGQSDALLTPKSSDATSSPRSTQSKGSITNSPGVYISSSIPSTAEAEWFAVPPASTHPGNSLCTGSTLVGPGSSTSNTRIARVLARNRAEAAAGRPPLELDSSMGSTGSMGNKGTTSTTATTAPILLNLRNRNAIPLRDVPTRREDVPTRQEGVPPPPGGGGPPPRGGCPPQAGRPTPPCGATEALATAA